MPHHAGWQSRPHPRPTTVAWHCCPSVRRRIRSLHHRTGAQPRQRGERPHACCPVMALGVGVHALCGCCGTPVRSCVLWLWLWSVRSCCTHVLWLWPVRARVQDVRRGFYDSIRGLRLGWHQYCPSFTHNGSGPYSTPSVRRGTPARPAVTSLSAPVVRLIPMCAAAFAPCERCERAPV